MTTTRATLGTLFQCRPMWFWHVIGGAMCLVALIRPLTFAGVREGAVIGVLVVPLWNGVISASLWRDTLSRPFSFFVPGHRRAWRRTLLAMALVLAAVCTTVTAFVPAPTPEAVAVRAAQVFFLCMGTFMLGVLITAWASNTSFLPGIISALFFASLDESIATHLRASVERALLTNALIPVLAGGAITAVAWRVLRSPALARKICVEPFLPLHSIWNSERLAWYARERKLRQRAAGRIMSLERVVVARMQRLSGHTTLRALWGTLYVQAGRGAPSRAANVVVLWTFMALVTVAMGFYEPHRMSADVSAASLILMVVCAISSEYRVDPHSTLLLNLSRGIRFRSLLFSATGQWLVVAAFAAVLTAISITAGRFLDEVTLFGKGYTYKAMHPMAFLLFAPMLPFIFLGQALFPRRNVLFTIVVTIVASIFFINAAHRVLEAPVQWLLLAQVLSWMPFLAYARHQCYAGDLTLGG